MGFLMDVRRIHVYQNQARTRSSTHVMHPFLNVRGPDRLATSPADGWSETEEISARKQQ